MSNVSEGSGVNPVHQEPGDYRLKIVSAAEAPAKSSGNIQWTWICQDMDRVSATYAYRSTLNEEALWKVRSLIVACGKQVPKKKIKFTPDSLVGQVIGATLDDNEYEGKISSQIVAVFPESDLPDNEKPAAKKKAPAKKAAPVKDEEDEEDEDLEELDIDEL